MEDLARDHGLVKRKRKLTGRLILESLLFGRDWSQPRQSLSELSLDILEQHQVGVSLQAIDKKLGPACESFLKSIFEKLLSQLLKAVHQSSGSIKKVNIKDSTKFKLPIGLRDLYPGTKGPGSEASISLQTQIDLLNNLLEVRLTAGSHNDQTESQRDLDDLQAGCLYIRDLGYISNKYMESIEQAEGYYLNRLPVKTRLFERTKKGFRKLTMKLLKKRIRESGGIMDEVLYLGPDKYPARVIMEQAPEEVKERRIRKINKYNKANGHQTTVEYKQRCGLNCWVTNLPVAEYDSLFIKNIYHLRWQIELIFKTWKSLLGIHRLSDCKASRVMCELYSRLILAVIHWASCRMLIGGGRVSFYKVAKVMTRTKQLLRKFLFDAQSEWLNLWMALNGKFIEVESKKGRLVSQKLIDSIT